MDDKSLRLASEHELEIRLPVDLLRCIEQEAVAKGMTVGDAINDAIAQYIEKRKR